MPVVMMLLNHRLLRLIKGNRYKGLPSFELRPKILKAGKVSNMLSCLWCQFDLLLWRHENFVFFL
jgi:hypothetical protein